MGKDLLYAIGCIALPVGFFYLQVGIGYLISRCVGLVTLFGEFYGNNPQYLDHFDYAIYGFILTVFILAMGAWISSVRERI